MSIEQKREETYREASDLLNQFQKCAIVRPCGFGKTGLCTKFLNEYISEGKHVLYLYPSEVVKTAVLRMYYSIFAKKKEEKTIPNVTFCTFMKLVSQYKRDKLDFGIVDLIIVDECHAMGAENTSNALKMLLEKYPKAKLLGVTATPQRSDNFDEITEFFTVKSNDNEFVSMTSDYTLHDAFKDGLFLIPYYCYCNYADPKKNKVDLSKKKELSKVFDGLSKDEKTALIHDFKEGMLKEATIWNAPNTIRHILDQYAETKYMKFIVFFSSFKNMKEMGTKVRSWFHKAYPDHKISVLKISSETPEYHDNTEKLNKMVFKENHIDLIYACDMLNLGYHVDNITGIMMVRKTESPIIYPQQFGRVISSNRTNGGIIFDMVDNIHTVANHSVLEHPSKFTDNAKKRYNELIEKKKMSEMISIYEKDPTNVVILQEEAEHPGFIKKLEEAMTHKEDFEWTNKDDKELNALCRRFPEPTKKQTLSAYDDLIVIGKGADYAAIVNKMVLEAEIIRRQKAAKNYVENFDYISNSTDNFKKTDGTIYTRKEAIALLPEKELLPLKPYLDCYRVAKEALIEELKNEERLREASEKAAS